MEALSANAPLRPQEPAKSSAGDRAGKDDEYPIELQLHHFIPRIPAALLKPGNLDLTSVLRFDANELGKRLATGDSSIPLSEIYKRMPVIFQCDLAATERVSIRFPWLKITNLLQGAQGGAEEGVKPTLPRHVVAALGKVVREGRGGHRLPQQQAAPSYPEKALPTPPRNDLSGSDRTWFTSKPVPAGALTLRTPEETTPENKPATPDSGAPRKPAPAGGITRIPNTVQPETQAFAQPARPQPAPAATDDAAATAATVAMQREIARELEKFRAEQELQFAALAERRQILAEHWKEALGEFDRMGQTLTDKVQELDSCLSGRATTQSQKDAQSRHAPELERLIVATDLKTESLAQEREILVALKAHLAAQFDQLRLSRQDYEKLHAESTAREQEFHAIQSAKSEAETRLASVSRERDTLGSEIEKLRTANAETAERLRTRDELQRRLTELEARCGQATEDLASEKQRRGELEAELASANERAAKGAATEARLREREEDFARLETELRGQIASATQANQNALAEQEKLRASVAKLEKDNAETWQLADAATRESDALKSTLSETQRRSAEIQHASRRAARPLRSTAATTPHPATEILKRRIGYLKRERDALKRRCAALTPSSAKRGKPLEPSKSRGIFGRMFGK